MNAPKWHRDQAEGWLKQAKETGVALTPSDMILVALVHAVLGDESILERRHR